MQARHGIATRRPRPGRGHDSRWRDRQITAATRSADALRGRARSGDPFEAGLEAVLPLGGTAATVMHTLAEDIAPALKLVMGRRHGPTGGYAHSGDFVMPNWQWVNMISAEAFVLAAHEWVEMGTQVIGGCCGIGPDYVRLLKEQLPAHIPATRTSGL